MNRKLVIAILAAVATFAILQFGIGSAEFKRGLDVGLLKQNASLLAAIGAVVVGALVFATSSNWSQKSN